MACTIGVIALLVINIGNRLYSAENDAEPTLPAPNPKPSQSDPHLDKTPPREAKGLDLIKLGWKYDCMECHKALKASWSRDRIWVEHKDITLNHGNNKFCLNCHHPTNRNAFKHDDGTEITEENVVQLCARCHGTTYRDWEAGAHGRINGYWDRTRGEQTRLRCIQCHDPHNPKFPTIESLAAPTYPHRAANSAKDHK